MGCAIMGIFSKIIGILEAGQTPRLTDSQQVFRTSKKTHALRSRFLFSGGFTLMELIIAMSIIAILSGALLANFFTSLSKGRDSRRKQDLELISKSLELYYNDNKAYPTSFPTPGIAFQNSDNTVVYMQKVPRDPKTGYTYTYVSLNSARSYQLYSCLENTNDSSYRTYTATCGGCNACSYGISSPDVTPGP